jgi:hypothetical protein
MRTRLLTTPVWAEEIRVEQTSESLIITGKNHTPWPVGGAAVGADLLAQSVPLVSCSEKRRKNPPHIEFANATTDTKLIKFCQKWGPYDGSPDVGHVRTSDSPHRWKVVRENLPKLRGGQKSFSGIARLIAEIQSSKPNPERLFQYYTQLSAFPPEREAFFRNLSRGGPAKAACEYVQTVVCTLLTQFPPHLYPTSKGPVELPPLNVFGRGVKHALYCFLRLEYLKKDRLGLGVCPRCGDVFAKEREGAVFCDEDCSKLHRSLKYYREHGRARRQEKTAASRAPLFFR